MEMGKNMKRIAINRLGRIARGNVSTCFFVDENENILRPKNVIRASGRDKWRGDYNDCTQQLSVT